MSEKNNFNNKNNEINENETEDGEIDECSSLDIKSKENEIEHYYMSLNALGDDLRCNCCHDVFSDPVTLSCQHLMDRYCVAKKIIGNTIECFKCHQKTICDDIDSLSTDFNIASRIPPKPKLLISIINKQKVQKMKERKKKKYISPNKDECVRSNKRSRRSRWSGTEDNSQNSVSGAIADILSSNNLPKNITMSQFKKYTEISSRSGIMKLLTKAVMESTNSGGHKTKSRNIDIYSDFEIIEMIPMNDLEDLFELEKSQFIILYKDALTKGVILPPSPNKASKAPLLPTPNPKTENIITKTVITPKHSNKLSSNSSDSDFSDKSSNLSSTFFYESRILDSPEFKLKTDYDIGKLSKLEINKEAKDISARSVDVIPGVEDLTKLSNECLPESTLMQHDVVYEGSVYRENVNRLHSIYSEMYLASLKMKEFENQLQSAEYHSAYKIYTENYSEYQKLYSSIQTALTIDSAVTETTESHQNVSKIIPVNTIINKSTPAVNLEQASSTISPNVYAPDSTESLGDNKVHTNDQCNLNSYPLQEYKKQSQLKKKKKYGYLWISNLCKDTRAMDLCKIFSNFGHVSKIKLFQYKAQTPMSFFSLIFMPNYNEAENAFKELQNTTLSNHQIHIRMLESDPLSEDEKNA